MRYTSPHPKDFREDVAQAMAETPAVCEQIHFPLQSGSDRILAAMHRGYTGERFLQRLEMMRSIVPDLAASTDVIVGFPGETDAEFEETCDTVRRAGFSKIHIFPFSARRTTPAADMPDQLPKKLKSARSKQLGAVEAELREGYFRSLIGRDLQVLAEAEDEAAPGRVTGTSCRYAPVSTPGGAADIGQLISVRATGLEDGVVQAERI